MTDEGVKEELDKSKNPSLTVKIKECYDLFYKDLVYLVAFRHSFVNWVLFLLSMWFPFVIFHIGRIGSETFSVEHSLLLYLGFSEKTEETKARNQGKKLHHVFKMITFIIRIYEMLEAMNTVGWLKALWPATDIFFLMMIIGDWLGEEMYRLFKKSMTWNYFFSKNSLKDILVIIGVIVCGLSPYILFVFLNR